MTRAELLAAINAHALEIGQPAVSDRRLGDWREQGLLPSPRPRGAGRGRGVARDWGDDALDAARQILRLQSMGERRASQHLAYLWLIGGPQQIDFARAAISAEFKRAAKRIRRRVPEAVADETPFAQEALRGRIGPLDQRLVPMVGLGPDGRPITETLAIAGLPAVFGEEGRSMSAAIAAIFPDLNELAEGPLIQDFLAGYDGLLGLKDETDQSALTALSEATNAEWEAAREQLQMSWLGLGFLALVMSRLKPEAKDALATVDRADWAIALFVQHLNGIQKSGKSKKIQD